MRWCNLTAWHYDTPACNLQHIVQVILVWSSNIYFAGCRAPCGPPQIFYQLANEASCYSSRWPVFINTPHGDYIYFVQNSQQIVSHGNNNLLKYWLDTEWYFDMKQIKLPQYNLTGINRDVPHLKKINRHSADCIKLSKQSFSLTWWQSCHNIT